MTGRIRASRSLLMPTASGDVTSTFMGSSSRCWCPILAQPNSPVPLGASIGLSFSRTAESNESTSAAPLDARDELAKAAARAAAEAESPGQPQEPKVSRTKLKKYGLRTLVLLFLLNLIDEFDRAVLAVGTRRHQQHLRTVRCRRRPPARRRDLHHRDRRAAGRPLVRPGVAQEDPRGRRVHLGNAPGCYAAMAQSFAQLFATRALLGFGQGTIGPTHLSILSDTYPQSVRGRVLGYHRAANPAGQVLGALIGGLIIGAFGWRWGFVAAAVPGLILAGLALCGCCAEPKHGAADLQQLVDDDPMVAAFLAEPADPLTFRQSLGRIWRIRTLRYCIFANATFGFAVCSGWCSSSPPTSSGCTGCRCKRPVRSRP